MNANKDSYKNNNEVFMLTTIDNPFNPFTEFDNWFQYDVRQGYNTCSKIARLCSDYEILSSYEENKNIEYAINRIIELDFYKMYKKVTKNDFKEPENGTNRGFKA